MEVHYRAALTDEERGQVEAWIKAHRGDDIESVAVHERVVSVYGRPGHLTAAAATALRQGDLRAELNLALANLKKMFRGRRA